MKKQFALLIAAIAFLPGCAKQSELTIESVKETATVTGKVTYDKGIVKNDDDTWTYTNYVAAEGVEVIARIPYSQYSSGNGYYTVTAKTDRNGKYSIDIPVTSSGVNVYMDCLPFYAAKTVNDGGALVRVDNALYNNTSVSPSTVNIRPLEIKTVNIQVTSSVTSVD